jgi:hypothetical protein
MRVVTLSCLLTPSQIFPESAFFTFTGQAVRRLLAQADY